MVNLLNMTWKEHTQRDVYVSTFQNQNQIGSKEHNEWSLNSEQQQLKYILNLKSEEKKEETIRIIGNKIKFQVEFEVIKHKEKF